MRKLLFIISLLLMTAFTNAQDVQKEDPKDNQACVMKASYLSIRMYSSDIKTFEHWCDPISTTARVRIDLDKKYITITELKYISMKLTDLIEEGYGELIPGGDTYVSYLFNAIDKQDRKLKVFIKSYESSTMTVLLLYDDIQMQYQGLKTSYTPQLHYTNH